MLLKCVPLDLCPGRDRRITDTLGPWARSQEYILRWKRCGGFNIDTDCDCRDTLDSRTIDLQFAISCTLISGLIVIVISVVVLACVATCVIGCILSRPMPLQESARCWSCCRDFTATLTLHLVIIHRINSEYTRAYGLGAYGAATGRAKSSEDKPL